MCYYECLSGIYRWGKEDISKNSKQITLGRTGDIFTNRQTPQTDNSIHKTSFVDTGKEFMHWTLLMITHQTD